MGATSENAGVRRMTSEERSSQLTGAALAIVAEGGYPALTLDSVAERAGVTRNLIYHYFPRGRTDLALAVVARAGEELTRDWLTDADVPMEQRLAENFTRFFEHAFEPSQIWLAHRHGRALGDPEVDALGDRYRAIIVRAVALNHFGTEEPGEVADAALRSYLAFGERVLDEWREQGLDRSRAYALLADTLLTVVESVRDSVPRTPAAR
jgi:AcrR family transcriptional regulator